MCHEWIHWYVTWHMCGEVICHMMCVSLHVLYVSLHMMCVSLHTLCVSLHMLCESLHKLYVSLHMTRHRCFPFIFDSLYSWYSYMRQDFIFFIFFIFVFFLMFLYHLARYISHSSLVPYVRDIHTWDSTDLYVKHDSFIETSVASDLFFYFLFIFFGCFYIILHDMFPFHLSFLIFMTFMCETGLYVYFLFFWCFYIMLHNMFPIHLSFLIFMISTEMSLSPTLNSPSTQQPTNPPTNPHTHSHSLTHTHTHTHTYTQTWTHALTHTHTHTTRTPHTNRCMHTHL